MIEQGPWGQARDRKFLPFKDSGSILWIAGILLAGAWLISGFYQVNPDEEGLVLRFGRLVQKTTPGWHYHIPFPVEKVLKPKVTTTNQITIGFGDTDESLMLTGDRNIVDVSVIVQWNIKNAEEFLFNIRQPEQIIKAVTESAIRDIIGQILIDRAFAEGRTEIQLKAKELVQEILDRYGAGVTITEINLKDVNPPQSVIESFREVDRANSDQERMINEAESYRNKKIHESRGQAAEIIAQGQAYKESILAKASGETGRFLLVAAQYAKSPQIMRTRLYLEMMEKVLESGQKILMEGKNAVLPHLALPPLLPQKGS